MIIKENDFLNMFNISKIDYSSWLILNDKKIIQFREDIKTDYFAFYCFKHFLKSVLNFKRVSKKHINNFKYIAYYMYYIKYISLN